LAEVINKALEQARAAYRIIDRTVVPIASDEERKTIEQAFQELGDNRFRGARSHLRAAAEALTNGDFAGSVRESIHSVESVARVLEPSASTLEPALRALAEKGYVHPALKTGFAKLYGYTSDEEGVRHAMLDGNGTRVDETDAIYMFGSCASFVTYLVRKS
jgi:hypothetical protein